jgi:hypothetical protein
MTIDSRFSVFVMGSRPIVSNPPDAAPPSGSPGAKPAAKPDPASTAPDPSLNKGWYVSATSATRNPAARGWLEDTQGFDSPIGPRGGMSSQGTIGNSPANPSEFIALMANGPVPWEGSGSAVFGPMGPMSEEGALNKSAYDLWLSPLLSFWQLGAANPFNPFQSWAQKVVSGTEQLEPGGALAIEGRGGLYSPGGAAGPVGPTGGFANFGLGVNADGDYVKKVDGKLTNEIVRSVPVAWSDTETRQVPLVEKYTPARAQEIISGAKGDPPLDASWIVDGATLKTAGDADTYPFEAPRGQLVNLVVVPTDAKAPADFHLDLQDASGRSLASSVQDKQVNWIQVWVPPAPAGSSPTASLTAKVTLAHPASGSTGPAHYRIMVVSPDHITDKDAVSGPQRLPLGTR